MLTKHPGFTIIAVVTLALGIGANTAIFSVVNALLLKPLPFPQPDELVAFGATDVRDKTSTRLDSVSYADFFDFRDFNRTLAAMAVYRETPLSLTSAEPASSVGGVKVSAEFFDVLGVKPAFGRGFVRSDEDAGGGPGGYKVVISHDFWMQQFGGDPNVLGRRIELDRESFTIIGVMPGRFQFPIRADAVDLYVTIALDASSPDGSKPPTHQRGSHMVKGIARLRPGVTASQAQSDVSAIAAALEKKYPDTNTHFGVLVRSLREELVGDVRPALYVLFAAVVCVLLIANANVANLLLARASVRAREMAIRAAVGASRARILRQLLIESAMLAGLGGIVGLLIAVWGTEPLIRAVPQNIPRISTIRLDGVVLAFTIAVSLITGVIFGVVPAWHASRVDLNSSLKSGGRGGSGAEQRGRLRNGLVMAEVSLALVLLIAAGLLLQSFARLGRVQLGLRTDRLLTASVQLPPATYPKNEDVVAFFDRFLERVRAVPGVESASSIVPLPLTGSQMTTDFDIEEHPLPEGQRAEAPIRVVATDYFRTTGIPLRNGRPFDRHDTSSSRPVVIVNERFAKKFFPGQNVIGKRIAPGFSDSDEKPKMREIIGVVGDVKHGSPKDADSPEMYVPESQMAINITSIVVRTSVANPTALTASLQAELAAMDRTIPLRSVRLFDDYVARSLARPRFNALLLSIFAGTALVLTAIGIYGVMAYSVAQRTNEIGIRMALGAAQSAIFRLVVGEAMTLVAISVAVGLAAAFAATRLLNSLLFGVSAADPLTFSIIVLLIAAVAFVAAWLPARRAAKVDPIIALRAE